MIGLLEKSVGEQKTGFLQEEQRRKDPLTPAPDHDSADSNQGHDITA
jgi:hypothetical protein